MLGNTDHEASEPEKKGERAGSAPADRRARRREATRAEILDAAWDLVREHGLAALSLRDLAARVGMRAPSLYQYFSSKHAIYDAMFGQGAREPSLASIRPAHDRRPATALREIAHRMFEFTTSDPARAQLLFQRTIPGFEPSADAYAPAVETVLAGPGPCSSRSASTIPTPWICIRRSSAA